MFELVTARKGRSTQSNVVVGSSVAVKVSSLNLNRKALTFQNQGSVTVFLGPTDAVTASGPTAGYALFTGITATDTATDQEWWAIAESSSAPLNITEVS